MTNIELLDEIVSFEKRNNISIVLTLCGDGSGELKEFWNDHELERFETLGELYYILENSNYRQENGLCVHPVEKV